MPAAVVLMHGGALLPLARHQSRSFCPALILQACFLQVWREKGLLFCLSDEGINAHHLPAFKLACQAGRTRGANAFAFDEGRAMLAVATKRCAFLAYIGTIPCVRSCLSRGPCRRLPFSACLGTCCLYLPTTVGTALRVACTTWERSTGSHATQYAAGIRRRSRSCSGAEDRHCNPRARALH